MKVTYRYNGRKVASREALFSAISHHVDSVGRSITVFLGMAAVQAMRDLTPVRTGRTKSNWSLASDGHNPAFDPSKIGDHPVDLSGLSPNFRRLTIANGSPSIPQLEHGSSDQAPSGMIGLTLMSSGEILRRALVGRKGLKHVG